MPRRIRPASAASPAATAPNSAPIRCAPRRWPMTPSRWSPRWRSTQGTQRFSPEVLTNPSGFAGIDGLFRFRADGTNERGLAVMKVGTGGARRSRDRRRVLGRSTSHFSLVGEGGAKRRRSHPHTQALERHPSPVRDAAHRVRHFPGRRRLKTYAARSATTASSTGKPACVTRSRPLASTVIAPSSRRIAIRPGSSVRPDNAA